MPSASIIIPTYNQPRYLELVLESLCRQTVTGFEVIVSDDGSTPETAELVASLQAGKLPYSLKYRWQPDEGFRVGEARNEGIRLASAEWLIFIDGDMLLHPRFVEAHLRLAAPQRLLFGGRVKLTEAFSQSLTPKVNLNKGIERERFYDPMSEGLIDKISGRFVQLFAGSYRGAAGRMMNSLSSLMTRKTFFKSCFKTGSNFSTSRRLMDAVNGFDRRFNGLSGEDGELFWRLFHAGAEIRSVLFTAIAYHLWHRENWQRVGSERQQALAFERTTRELALIRCEDGLYPAKGG